MIDVVSAVEPGRRTSTEWRRYLQRFHTDRAGITEAVLRRSHADGIDPYQWLARAAPHDGLVLDIGCGSGPLLAELPGRRRIGLDRSGAELAAARAADSTAFLVQADATAIPVRDVGIDTVTCSMSLMVAVPLVDVIAEIVRVLRPGGTLVATVPAAGPLGVSDRAALAGLVTALGAAPAYPAGRRLARIPALLTSAGLQVTSDERRRFAYPLHDAVAADRFLESLYLPGLPATRLRVARSYLRVLAHRHRALGIPLRLLTARRTEPYRTPSRGYRS